MSRINGNARQAGALILEIEECAGNLFESRQFLCAEAVLTALNRGLGGGLTDAQAVSLSAPFCDAIGGSGCLCGALSGAIMGAGLFLGQNEPYRRRKELRDCGRQLHDMFKAANGATCCRVLTKRVKHDKRAHFKQCAELSAGAAGMAAGLILEKRPELISEADTRFLEKRRSAVEGGFVRLLRLFPSVRRLVSRAIRVNEGNR